MNRAGVRYLAVLVALPVIWFAVALPALTMFAPEFGSGVADDLECGRRLVDGEAAEVPLVASVRVVLVTDEEWRSRVPDPTGAVARRVLLDAASLFRGLSIHFIAVRAVDWESPDSSETIRDTWLAAQSEVPLVDEDAVVVLSAQRRADSLDGYSEVGGEYIVIAHHPRDPDLDSLVLAHEVSHLFGAHHGCDVEGREGLMGAEGFDHDLICPCTRRILELNVTRFHEARE